MTLNLSFHTDKKGRGIWTVSVLVRFLLAFIFAVITASFALALTEGFFFALQIIIFLMSFSACCYEERWIIDPGTRMCTFRIGLLFLAKKPYRIPFSDISSVQLLSVYGRSGKVRQVSCRLKMSEARDSDTGYPEDFIVLETVSGKNTARLEEKAGETARLIGTELEKIQA